jgi:hypothetical protein
MACRHRCKDGGNLKKGKVELLGLVSELDRLIGAVGVSTLNLSQTAEKIKVTGDALNFYASVESYREQHIR